MKFWGEKRRINCLIGRKVIQIRWNRDDLDREIVVTVAVNRPFINNQHHHHRPDHENNQPTRPAYPIKSMKIHRKPNEAHRRKRAKKIPAKSLHRDSVHAIVRWINRKVVIRARKIIPIVHPRNVNPRNKKVTPNHRLFQTFKQNLSILLKAKNEAIAHAHVHALIAIKVAVRADPDPGNTLLSHNVAILLISCLPFGTHLLDLLLIKKEVHICCDWFEFIENHNNWPLQKKLFSLFIRSTSAKKRSRSRSRSGSSAKSKFYQN